eukprot:GHVN01090054.1.p1 GENE.GHVN01090054.1~~GHVN01090054.1.p1  ORF type:complete len:1058 (+),score=162.19 GHVN01090054.1:315-3176(+)
MAPKIAKCGHFFCSPCVGRYMSVLQEPSGGSRPQHTAMSSGTVQGSPVSGSGLTAGSTASSSSPPPWTAISKKPGFRYWRRCPVCAEPMTIDDLRSVRFQVMIEAKEDRRMSLCLVNQVGRNAGVWLSPAAETTIVGDGQSEGTCAVNGYRIKSYSTAERDDLRGGHYVHVAEAGGSKIPCDLLSTIHMCRMGVVCDPIKMWIEECIDLTRFREDAIAEFNSLFPTSTYQLPEWLAAASPDPPRGSPRTPSGAGRGWSGPRRDASTSENTQAAAAAAPIPAQRRGWGPSANQAPNTLTSNSTVPAGAREGQAPDCSCSSSPSSLPSALNRPVQERELNETMQAAQWAEDATVNFIVKELIGGYGHGELRRRCSSQAPRGSHREFHRLQEDEELQSLLKTIVLETLSDEKRARSHCYQEQQHQHQRHEQGDRGNAVYSLNEQRLISCLSSHMKDHGENGMRARELSNVSACESVNQRTREMGGETGCSLPHSGLSRGDHDGLTGWGDDDVEYGGGDSGDEDEYEKEYESAGDDLFGDNDDDWLRKSRTSKVNISSMTGKHSNTRAAVKYNQIQHQASPQSTGSSTTNLRWLYQSSSGELCYLHPLLSRCMLHEYGSHVDAKKREAVGDQDKATGDQDKPPEESWANLPVLLRNRKIQSVTKIFLSKECRQRYRFLSHLPVHSSVAFVEVDIGDLLSGETKRKFGDELRKRAHARAKTRQRTAEEALEEPTDVYGGEPGEPWWASANAEYQTSGDDEQPTYRQRLDSAEDIAALFPPLPSSNRAESNRSVAASTQQQMPPVGETLLLAVDSHEESTPPPATSSPPPSRTAAPGLNFARIARGPTAEEVKAKEFPSLTSPSQRKGGDNQSRSSLPQSNQSISSSPRSGSIAEWETGDDSTPGEVSISMLVTCEEEGSEASLTQVAAETNHRPKGGRKARGKGITLVSNSARHSSSR